MPHDRKPGPRRKKLVISFDDKNRSEYLTGFQKRKQQRRLKAQNDIEKKLKQKVRDERNKKRKAMKEKAEEILSGVYGADELTKDQEDTVSQSATEKVEFENHEVFVNTDLNFADSGFFIENTQEREEENSEQQQGEDQQEVETAQPKKKDNKRKIVNERIGKQKKKKTRKV
uniref:Nucleolar protein 12 n=1 Tax=Clytia hemisphaerica TaxID=252671 RepID=A0A7M5X229_9CNID